MVMKQYLIELVNDNGAVSPIDHVMAEIGYTPEKYVLDCSKYADTEWYEMVKNHTIKVVKLDY